MDLKSSLEAVGARCRTPAWNPSAYQPTMRDRNCTSSHSSRVFLCRNGGERPKNGAILRLRIASPHSSGAFLPHLGCKFRARAKSVEVEIVDGEVPQSEAEDEQNEITKSEDEEFGIDADGNLTASLPPEFLELMKDEGPAPNYWLAAFAVAVVFVARKSIWKEVKLWGKVVLASGHLAVNAVILFLKQLVAWGGVPLRKVLLGFAVVGLTVRNVLKFIADVVPPLPVLLSVTLASIVLLVGESVSDTYNSSAKEFPSRGILDTAGLLGLGAFVGILPVEISLLGIAAITVFLLAVKKVNPVAGFTPVAAVFAALAEPIVRYPVVLAFVGAATYRFWRLGYMSPGAVQMERAAEYPRILIFLLYLVAVSFAARTVFFILDSARILILAATA